MFKKFLLSAILVTFVLASLGFASAYSYDSDYSYSHYIKDTPYEHYEKTSSTTPYGSKTSLTRVTYPSYAYRANDYWNYGPAPSYYHSDWKYHNGVKYVDSNYKSSYHNYLYEPVYNYHDGYYDHSYGAYARNYRY